MVSICNFNVYVNAQCLPGPSEKSVHKVHGQAKDLRLTAQLLADLKHPVRHDLPHVGLHLLLDVSEVVGVGGKVPLLALDEVVQDPAVPCQGPVHLCPDLKDLGVCVVLLLLVPARPLDGRVAKDLCAGKVALVDAVGRPGHVLLVVLHPLRSASSRVGCQTATGGQLVPVTPVGLSLSLSLSPTLPDACALARRVPPPLCSYSPCCFIFWEQRSARATAGVRVCGQSKADHLIRAFLCSRRALSFVAGILVMFLKHTSQIIFLKNTNLSNKKWKTLRNVYVKSVV